ncbi:MAG: hypothetical protein KAX38_01000, partial [Candidatus Krumholzibacteria bacterium]|nr:hypothetical protein [Candidatus Krumholzibacteria bacterium]
MRNLVIYGYRMAAVAAIFIIAYTAPALSDEPGKTVSSEFLLRQHLISFLQSGSTLENIPPKHALYPLARTSIIATASYLLMEHDPSMLKRFYPDIKNLAIARFDRENMTDEGLIPETFGSSQDGDICIDPGTNSLANLELFSLHLIASRIGAYKDAIELLSWSRKMSETISRIFYEPARDCFFPVDSNSRFLVRYSPEYLLPLLLDRRLGETSRQRIIERFTTRRKMLLKSAGKTKGNLWKNPLYRPMIRYLLSNIDAPSDTLMKTLSQEITSGKYSPDSPYRAWLEFWRERPASRKSLFPPWTVISSLLHLSLLMERESLLEPKDLYRLREDVDSLMLKLS